MAYEGLLRDVDIVVDEDGRVWLGKELHGDEKIDCKGLLALHGFANVHTHLTHGFSAWSNPKDFSWLKHHEEIYPREAAIEIAKLSLVNSLETGTTLVADTTPYFEVLSLAAEKVGLRYIPVSRWGSGEGLTGSPILIESIEQMEESLDEVAGLQVKGNRLLLMHVSSDKRLVFQFRKEKGKFPVEYLYSKGVLGSKTILLSPGWITSWEVGLVAESGAKVAVTPVASLHLADGGLLPHSVLAERGVTPGLCSDSPVIGITANMVEQVKTYYLYQRGFFENEAFSIYDAYLSSTSGGYRALGIMDGLIKDGVKADLVFYALDELALNGFLGPPEQFFLALNGQRAKYVVVEGELVLSPERRGELYELKRKSLERLRDLGYPQEA